ncbi:MAG: endolytic transglycosylase MltG [Treponema sp.]|nr:endolytic transglycosylase MltG [Treponema sp.]
MKNSKKIIRISIISLCSLIVLAAVIFGSVFIPQLMPVQTKGEAEDIKFIIPYGENAYQVTQRLSEENLIKNKKIFYYCLLRPKYLKILYPKLEFPQNISFKSGIYYLNKKMNYGQIIKQFCDGSKEFIKISFPEGLTISKIGKLLEEEYVCSKDDFYKACHDTEILKKYNINSQSAEGFLFPDTYYFDFGNEPKLVVCKMIDNFFEKIKQIPQLDGKSPEDFKDILILASIVEREYKLSEEAPLIASVFNNRVKNNDGLYSCATIEYIITEIQGKPHPERIFEADLQIDNPYNTYKWRGLPPGPISNPGIIALKAAVEPADTDYYFFQLVDADIGKHIFSKTFDEHKQNHRLLPKR